MGTIKYMVIFSVFVNFWLTKAQDVVYSIPEERDADYLIGNIANDVSLQQFMINPDEINNMKYSLLLPGNVNISYFRINNRTSDLYTSNNTLDRDTICKFEIQTCEIVVDVLAQSMIGNFFKRIAVKVLLQDINDNPPVFSKNETSLEFSESSVLGFSQPIEGATDLDRGNNSVQKYSILENNTPFSVDFDKYVDGSSSVRLILMQKLDREIQASYHLTIVAEDGGISSKTGTLKVNITVTDVNDNAPIFEKSTYNITVNESMEIGKIILDVTAVDPDLGNNGKISYRLSPHQDDSIRKKFHVNETTGDLSINQSLMYEAGKFYRVIIEGSDHGVPPMLSQTTVFVYILDSVNDPPIISINLLSNSDKAKISENAAKGAAVAHVEVTDRDDGTNGNFSCHVDNNYFKLDSLETDNSKTREFKVVVDRALDREDIDRHTVRVICHDGGSPPKTATSVFYVIVLDENDHAPMFSQENFIAYVEENNNIGASVLQVLAYDYDIGINGQVLFSLANLQNHDFRIDANAGHIYVNFKLDRENVSQYNFNVVAVDKGTPAQTGSARVIVMVKDVNDNRPKFSNPFFTFEVLENQENYSFVGRVYADDPDDKENGSVSFRLSPESPADLPFRVLSNGSIFHTEVLNHESKPHGYHFNVIALDNGNPPLNSTTRVSVFLKDENDNDPIILFPNSQNRSVTILYDIARTSVVTKIKALDKDTGLNSKLTFSILDNEIRQIFNMNPETGEITLARPLTMEDIKSYTFSILVEDKGVPKRYAEENLTIVVISQGLVAGQSDQGQDYLLIVVIILCVTILMSGVIVLTICLIRRIDFNKKRAQSKRNQVQRNGTINKDMYDAIVRNLEPVDPKERAEKKVSFSMDNLADESSTDPDYNLDKMAFQIPPPSSCDVDELLDKISSPSSKSERLSNMNNNSRHNNKQMKTLQLHQKHLQSHDKSWTNQNSISPNDMYKKQEDNHSETSGETVATSDSGRGGSESDIQSTGGLSHSYELDLLKTTPPSHIAPDKTNMIGRLNHTNLRNMEKHNRYKHSGDQIYPVSLNKHVSYLPNQTSRHIPYSESYNNHRTSRWTELNDVVNGSMATIDDYDDDTTTSGSYTVDEDSIDTDVKYGMDCIV